MQKGEERNIKFSAQWTHCVKMEERWFHKIYVGKVSLKPAINQLFKINTVYYAHSILALDPENFNQM